MVYESPFLMKTPLSSSRAPSWAKWRAGRPAVLQRAHRTAPFSSKPVLSPVEQQPEAPHSFPALAPAVLTSCSQDRLVAVRPRV